MLQEFYITAFDRQKNLRRDGPTITNRDYIILFKAVTVVVFFFFQAFSQWGRANRKRAQEKDR